MKVATMRVAAAGSDSDSATLRITRVLALRDVSRTSVRPSILAVSTHIGARNCAFQVPAGRAAEAGFADRHTRPDDAGQRPGR